MRAIIALVLIIYLIGVGVALAPTVRAGWSTAPAAELADGVVKALPDALAWPMRAYRGVTGRP
jgi:hypothetical protein